MKNDRPSNLTLAMEDLAAEFDIVQPLLDTRLKGATKAFAFAFSVCFVANTTLKFAVNRFKTRHNR